MFLFPYVAGSAGITLAIIVAFYLVIVIADIFRGKAKPISVLIVLGICLWTIIVSFNNSSSGDKLLSAGCLMSVVAFIFFDSIHLKREKSIQEILHNGEEESPLTIPKCKYSPMFMAAIIAFSFILWMLAEKAGSVETWLFVLALLLILLIGVSCIVNGVNEFKKESFRYHKHVKDET